MANSEDITRFTAVDHGRFLDEGNKIPDIVSSKPIILSGLRLTGGERVLDLGCGLGDDTFEIARVVGSRGRAVGVDVSETIILEARRRAASLDLAVELEVGDAQALRFDDGVFDACRTERMLMHGVCQSGDAADCVSAAGISTSLRTPIMNNRGRDCGTNSAASITTAPKT